jgi:hypothetical protein
MLPLFARKRTEIAPGAVHLPDWLDLEQQISLIEACRQWATGPAPMCHTRLANGAVTSVQTVCPDGTPAHIREDTEAIIRGETTRLANPTVFVKESAEYTRLPDVEHQARVEARRGRPHGSSPCRYLLARSWKQSLRLEHGRHLGSHGRVLLSPSRAERAMMPWTTSRTCGSPAGQASPAARCDDSRSSVLLAVEDEVGVNPQQQLRPQRVRQFRLVL